MAFQWLVLAGGALRTLLVGAGIGLAAAPACAALSDSATGGATVPGDPQALVEALGHQYPPGSITSPELAERALVAARAASASLQARFEARRRACAHVFFVNRCLDVATQEQRAGEHVVRLVTLQAHDLQRHRDAELHAQSRAQALRDQANEDLLRPQRELQAKLNARTREDNARAREADEQRDLERAAQDSAAAEARARAHVADVARKDAARPGQEASAARDYRQKQEQASAYARTRAEDREANGKRRDEREKARDAQAAADQRAAAAVPASPAAKP